MWSLRRTNLAFDVLLDFGQGSAVKRCLLTVLRHGLAVIGLGLMTLGTAHSGTWVGKWDPKYGKPFDYGSEVLGWRGTAAFEIPDECISTGTVQSADCVGMQFISAQVTFYDYLNGPEIETFDYATTDLGAFAASFDASGVLTSLTSGFFAPRQPVDTGFSIIDLYSFSLQFVDAGVRMYHTKDYEIGPFDIGPYSPEFCKKWQLPYLVCGYSGSYSDGSSAPAVVVTFNKVPEPGTLLLIGAALLAGVALRPVPRSLALRCR
jgi:hypothetical protein